MLLLWRRRLHLLLLMAVLLLLPREGLPAVALRRLWLAVLKRRCHCSCRQLAQLGICGRYYSKGL